MRITPKLPVALAAIVLASASVLGAGAASAEPATSSIKDPHEVPISTTAVARDGYLLKFSLDNNSESVHVNISVGDAYKLSVENSGRTLTITSRSTGEVADSLDLGAILEHEDIDNVAVSTWQLSGIGHAAVTLSANALAAAQAASTQTSVAGGGAAGTGRVGAIPMGKHDAWYNCMSAHGIQGAVAGAVAGCAVSIEIGCVEGAVTGWTSGGIGGLVSGLFACRSKW